MTRQATAARVVAIVATVVVLGWMAGAALASDTTEAPPADPQPTAGPEPRGGVAAADPTPPAALAGAGLAADAAITEVLDNGDGTATVTVLLTVANSGDTEMRDVSLVDDVAQHLADLSPTGFLTLDGSLLANPRWDGTGRTSAIADGQALQPGQSGDVGISFIVEAGTAAADSQLFADNQMLAVAMDGDGQSVTAAASHVVELGRRG